MQTERQDVFLGLTIEQVRDFLASNPNFLVDNADLLHALTPPRYNRGQNVIDFQHYMLDRLQQDVELLDQYRDALMLASRANLTSQQQVHAALLSALDADSFDTLAHVITSDWVDMLNVDAVALCFECEPGDAFDLMMPSGAQRLQPGDVARVMGREGAILLRDHLTAASRAVFGPAAGLISAEALVRLAPGPNRPLGILAMGSRDPDYYTPGQGTELLRYTGASVERLLDQWLARAR
ncbi:DUF484 family protein [Govanella unica]|uniref:DUF484 family protein n=1 Tax=Govanella unica TaxID=2975056 RepID=A0A9X3TW12_9PROT|nr:DUF484 family protein [Govania unica]